MENTGKKISMYKIYLVEVSGRKGRIKKKQYLKYNGKTFSKITKDINP